MVSGPPSPVESQRGRGSEGNEECGEDGTAFTHPGLLHLSPRYLSISCTDGVKSPRVPTGELCRVRYMGNFAFSWRNPLLSPKLPEKGKLSWKSSIISIELLRPVSKLQKEGTSAHFIHLCSWSSEEETEICRVKWLTQGLRICPLADLGLEHRSVASGTTFYNSTQEHYYYYCCCCYCCLFWCVWVRGSNVNRDGSQKANNPGGMSISQSESGLTNQNRHRPWTSQLNVSWALIGHWISTVDKWIHIRRGG